MGDPPWAIRHERSASGRSGSLRDPLACGTFHSLCQDKIECWQRIPDSPKWNAAHCLVLGANLLWRTASHILSYMGDMRVLEDQFSRAGGSISAYVFRQISPQFYSVSRIAYVCIYVRIYIRIYMRLDIRIYWRIYIYIYVYTYVYSPLGEATFCVFLCGVFVNTQNNLFVVAGFVTKSLSRYILQDHAFLIPSFFGLVRSLIRGWSLFDGAVFMLSRGRSRGSIIAWRIVSSRSSAISGVSHAPLFICLQGQPLRKYPDSTRELQVNGMRR